MKFDSGYANILSEAIRKVQEGMAMTMKRFWGITFFTLLIVFLLVGGIGFLGVSNFVNQSNDATRSGYCSAARLSSYTDHIDRFAMADYGGNYSYYSFESKKYKTVEAMCEDLPICSSADAMKTLTTKVGEDTTDVGNTPIERYEIDPKMMPLDAKTSDSIDDTHYCILEYPDGKYRFTVIIKLQNRYG